MARIFFALSLFSLVVLLAVIASGFMIGDFNASTRDVLATKRRVQAMSETDAARGEAERDYEQALARFRPLRSRNSWHTIFGTAGALIALLVNSLSVTYFIGTGKWCGEVVETYELDPALADKSRLLKKRSFPWSLGSIAMLVMLIASGAASDPLANFSGSSAFWVTPHLLLSLAGTVLLGVSFWVQVGYIGAHYEIIETVLSEVKRIREARGLE